MSKLIIYTDQELLTGLSLNDTKAVAEIYRLYQPMLLKWMLSRGGSETDAYDVFQEGVLVLFEKANNPDFLLTSKLSTYLFAVCKRIWFKQSSSQAHIGSIAQGYDDEDVDGDDFAAIEEDLSLHLEKEEQFNKLEQSLDQLGSPCSDLLKAFYIQEKSMMSIAQDFGYTNAENAKTQKYKCLNRLKKLFFSTKMMLKN